MKNTVLILCFISVFNIFAGTPVDSLKRAYQTTKNDSIRASVALQIADFYEHSDIEQAIKWGAKALDASKKFPSTHNQVRVKNYVASYYGTKGDFNKQLGLYFSALKSAEKHQFYDLQASITGNIGSTYVSLENAEEAKKWLTRAIELKEKYSSPDKLAITVSALGAYYFQLGDYEEAIRQHQRSLNIRKVLGDEQKMATNLINMADCYLALKKYTRAEELYKEAIALKKKLGDPAEARKTMLHLSWLYSYQKKYALAERYADSVYNIAAGQKLLLLQHDAALQLAEIHENTANYKSAFAYQKEAYLLWKDIFQREANDKLNELRTQYETERFEVENDLLKKNSLIKDLDLQKSASQIANQRLIIGVAGFGLSLLVLLILILNKWNREKKRQNTRLSEQKDLVETKNREILDSIRYAKRIQAAILPSARVWNANLASSFVFYQPKDVVAGDFYWMEVLDDSILFAVADCTGHGVPGALVSVFCNNGLNRSVREYRLSKPGEILDSTRRIVLEEFEKSEEEVNDGMDVALCCFSKNKLTYAGASIPLWLVRNGKLIEYRPNKQPIGRSERKEKYHTHEIDIKAGDCIYLSTDGFADQFGGELGKKLKSVKLKQFLIENHKKSPTIQKELLEQYFRSWQGDQEQVDDVCVIGIQF